VLHGLLGTAAGPARSLLLAARRGGGLRRALLLRPAPGLLDRLLVEPRLALEVRAFLDGKPLVEDLAFHARAVHQHDPVAADDAGDLAAHDHLVGGDVAIHGCRAADGQVRAADVTPNLAVDLQFAVAFERAGYQQAGVDYGSGRRHARLGARVGGDGFRVGGLIVGELVVGLLREKHVGCSGDVGGVTQHGNVSIQGVFLPNSRLKT
jgi:hypothetical protein